VTDQPPNRSDQETTRLPEPPARGLTLIEALIASADGDLWVRYCRLAAELEGRPAEPPVYAPGSVEWQRQQNQPTPESEKSAPPCDEAAGRRRLSRRGAELPFAGAPSPFGAAGGDAFDAFLARHRAPPALLAQIDLLEQELVGAFEAAFRSGLQHASGFRDGGETALTPQWFGGVRLDFARNAVVLPDRSEIAGIAVTIGLRPNETRRPSTAAGRRERQSQTMLRGALTALWERGAFTAGTGNERVLALALGELGLSPSAPPYGFKSAETVRKLRKALNMSL
jgi:hypothetical protein